MRTVAHVLLLNASLDESDMYAVWLKLNGYRVTVADDVASARHIVRGDAVDVLVIDALHATDFARTEFVRRWTKLAHRDRLPIVILSGYLTDAQSPTQNADEVCVFKPCPPQQLTSHIAELLAIS